MCRSRGPIDPTLRRTASGVMSAMSAAGIAVTGGSLTAPVPASASPARADRLARVGDLLPIRRPQRKGAKSSNL